MVETIFPKPSSKEPVIFHEQWVSYGDTEIRYDEAIGISFSSYESTGAACSSYGVICIRAPSKRITIKIRNQSWLGLGNLKNNYDHIVATALEHLTRPITQQLVHRITSGSSVEIGRMLLDAKGITVTPLIGSRRRVTWGLKPEVRSLASGIPGMSSVSGVIEISYFCPSTGKMIVVGKTTSHVENGCFVPHLVRILNDFYNDAPRPTTPESKAASHRTAAQTSTGSSQDDFSEFFAQGYPQPTPAPPTKPQRPHRVAACISIIETELLRRSLSVTEEQRVAEMCARLLQMALGEQRIVIRIVKLEWAQCHDIVEAFRRAEDRWERDHNRFG